MRLGLTRTFVSIVALLIIGCGPSVSEDELGRIVYEVPEIPEGYEPYELPSLVSPEAVAVDEAE